MGRLCYTVGNASLPLPPRPSSQILALLAATAATFPLIAFFNDVAVHAALLSTSQFFRAHGGLSRFLPFMSLLPIFFWSLPLLANLQ